MTSRPAVFSGEARAQWLEAAWRAGKRPFRQMIDALPEAIYITDAEGHLTYFNPAAVRFFGREPELGVDRWCASCRLYEPDGTPMPHDECPMAVAVKEGRAKRGAEGIAERPDGTRIWFEAYPSPLCNEAGEVVGGINMVVDVTEKRRERRLQEEQSRLLELVATGRPLEECLSVLCKGLSRLDPGVRASILLAGEEGQAFRRPIAPDLPPEWGDGLEGVPIDALTVGTCGEAIFRGEPVTCEDIESDERWPDKWRQLCLASGVRASHSEPICSEDGAPLGLLMLCFDEARAPSVWERRLADFGTHVASVALERDRSRQALRESKERLASKMADMERLHVLSTRLLRQDDVEAALHEVMTASAELLRADKASTQIYDEEGDVLRLVSTLGFDQAFIDQFQIIETDSITTCAAALDRREQVLVEDLAADPDYVEFSRTVARYDARAAFSAPLYGTGGQLLGMFTMYWEDPHRPAEDELKLLDLYTQQAARQIERHRSHEALRKNEERFRAFVTASSDVVYSMSPDWTEMRYLEGRDFIADTREPSRSWIDKYIHPDDQKQVREAINEAIRTKSTFELEHRVLRADDTLGWTSSRAVPILDEEGEIVEWFGAARDITERKEAEAELARITAEAERQKRLYETIISSTPDLVYVFDLDYRFTFVNDALLEMWGRTLEESIGKTLQEVGYEPWHAKMHEREIDQVVATKQPVRGEVSFPHATLGRRIYDYIFVPVLNDEGEVEAVAGTTRDVTERKRHERKLEDAKAQLEAATEAGAVGTWEWHIPEDKFVAGASFARLFGVDPDAARDGVPLERFVSSIHADDVDDVEAKIEEAVASCGEYEAEYRVRNADGEFRWVVARGRVECDEDGNPVTFPGALTDITERKRAEKALQNLTETLEERVKERTKQVQVLFSRLTMAEQKERRRLAEILHDNLQQRLYGIQMRMTFLRQHAEAVEADARKKLLDEVRKAEDWMEEAIATTRQLSVDLHPPVLKKEGLAEALGWLKTQMKELHGLDIDLEAERTARIADEDLRVFLFQVVRELLFNVVKHAGVGRATVELTDADGDFVIRVADEGQGFDPGEVEERSHDEGFGLTAARERLELFGGGLEVDSAPGAGTRMTVHVPLSPVLIEKNDG